MSLAIGIILSPFSLLGLIILIGALGFVPFFTAIVYLRNAVRAIRSARNVIDWQTIVYSAAFGGIFSFVIPFAINMEIHRSLTVISKGDAAAIRSESWKLRLAAPLVNVDMLAILYHRSSDEERKTPRMEAIAELYKEMTGNNMEERSWVLMD